MKIPFSEWLKYNKKHTIAINKLRISNDSKYKRKLLSEKIRQYRKDNISYNYLNFNLYLNKHFSKNNNHKLSPPDKNKGIPCYQIIVHILKSCNIINFPKYSIKNMIPDDLIALDKFLINKEFGYNDFYLTNINSLNFISD